MCCVKRPALEVEHESAARNREPAASAFDPPSPLSPIPSSGHTSSDAAKKKATSIAAFSSESEPWIALRSIEVP